MEENENEGLSTGKKVVAGAAIGVAVPAAVGVAKKLMGDGDDQEDGGGESGRSQQGGRRTSQGARQSRRSTGSARGRAPTAKKRAGSTAKSGTRRASTRTGSAARSTGTRARSSSSSSPRSSSSSGGGSNRTKEQLYNQAKRLGIEGRSTMTKAQLERAINRARSRS
jgi:hypothetical protein